MLSSYDRKPSINLDLSEVKLNTVEDDRGMYKKNTG